MRLLLTVLLFAVTLQTSAQPETTRLPAAQAPEGITYYLPKTAIRLHLLVERKTYTPGIYANYAEKYLNLSDVALEPSTDHTLTRMEITTTGIRDTSKCYNVRMKGGKCETAELVLNDEGVLVAVNDTPLSCQPRSPFSPSAKPAVKDAREYLPSDILSAGSVAKMAQLTAQLIYELQERRLMLITGEGEDMPQDESQLRLMISETDAERQALTTLFTGTISRDTTEHTIELCPSGPIERQVLFRMSRPLGLVDADDLSGVPYYVSIQNLSPTPQALPENKKQEGFYVCQPGIALMTLTDGQQTLGEYRLPLAQFGFSELRAGQQFKRYVTHMTLHPATGAVVRLYSDSDR